jgi:hypothetical protein
MGKWQRYTVYISPKDRPGTQRLITEWKDENNHTYIPAGLPGNPRSGERIALWFPRKHGPYTHCAVGERLYRSVNDPRGWRLYWEPVSNVN